MEDKKLGQEPAFANTETYNPNNMECNGTYQQGMSKRFYAACAAMQGILASGVKVGGESIITPEIVIPYAYKFADELLKQENA